MESHPFQIAPVKVFCRFHPQFEPKAGNDTVASGEKTYEIISDTTVTISPSPEECESFTFDRVFPGKASQEEVYEHSARELIGSVLNGYDGIIIAYGQTGTGKSFTLQGTMAMDSNDKGFILRMAHQIFSVISLDTDIKYTVTVSMFTIYSEQMQDLLHVESYNMLIKENPDKTVFLENLSEHIVKDEEGMLEVVQTGLQNGQIEITKMSHSNARMHTLIIISILQENQMKTISKRGRLTLVEVAGSERQQQINLKESIMVHHSLISFEKVVNLLANQGKFIPYRDSKLTRYLQSSFEDNALVVFLITCSSKEKNTIENIFSLRFGRTVKKLMNKIRENKA